MVSTPRQSPNGTTRAKCRLEVELEIEFGQECLFHEVDIEPESINIFLTECSCTCQYSVEHDDSDSSVFQMTDSVGERCVCRVFSEYGCVPNIEDVSSMRFVISTCVPDREVLTGLIADLKDVSNRVRLLRIVEETGGRDGERTVSFNLRALTRIQRETLEAAVTSGYYDEDVEYSLEDLSEDLDVSKSALSRRLSRAEATVVSELVKPD